MEEDVQASFVESIGNTKLLELPSLSAAVGSRVLCKMEYASSSGSVKDRAARGMVAAALAAGQRELVEATAGNTGIALGQLCRAAGVRMTCCVPDTTAEAKLMLLRTLCHELVLCPAVARDDPRHFHNTARRIAEERGAFYTNQFYNEANYTAHFTTTGPEVWRQTAGKCTTFVCASGTGGTIGGVSNFLRPKGVKLALVNAQHAGITADPNPEAGQPMVFRDKLPTEPKSDSILEGIGSGALYGNLARAVIDDVIEVSDAEAIAMTRYLLLHEGLFVGGTSGLNVCGAVKAARKWGPGQCIVTILCDSGERYLQKHWGSDVLEKLGLPEDVGKDLSFLK